SLYEHGARLMESQDPADWERAWRDYLEPLGERYPDHPYQKQVEEFRRRIEAARRPEEAPPVSEARPLYRQGEHLLEQGDPARARWLGREVASVFAGVPSEDAWVRKAREGLAELDRQEADLQRWAPVRAALKRAAALAAEGKRDEAEAVWHGIEE